MSLRKVAGLLAAFGLTVGLVGGGVGAVFQDQVQAIEHINVGTFSCGITTATAGATFGAIDALGYAHTVSYTAPTINGSAASSAPFSFTVKNTGSIPDVLTVTESPALSTPWSYIPVVPAGPVPLAAGASQAFATGVQWTELSDANLGQTGTMTWTVNCGEAAATTFTTFGPATVTENPAGTYTIVTTAGGTAAQCAPYAAGCITWGGVDLTNKNSGKLIGNVAFSFTSSGQSGGGAPRFSLPISTDGTTIAFYAFLDPVSCGAAPNATFTVSTSVATCVVNINIGGSYANWAAFVAAHPTYEIAPGAIPPYIVADGSVGTYIVSAISE